MVAVSEAFLSTFFETTSSALEGLEIAAVWRTTNQGMGRPMLLSDCRRCVLQKQISVLAKLVEDHNHNYGSTLTIEQAQERLAVLKDESPLPESLQVAKQKMEDTARLALCRLVLYAEMKFEAEDENTAGRELQTKGHLERPNLLEFMALCRTAVKLPETIDHLVDGTPLFPDLPLEAKRDEEPTAMQLPQARLERIQQYISKAIGWDPQFTTDGLRRLFMQPDTNEYADDGEIMELFQQSILQMNQVVANASIQVSRQQLSDVDKGGVTRVVSVQYSEVSVGNSAEGPSFVTAPTRVIIDPHFTDEEQKQQIRVASEATRLREEIVSELMGMSEDERSKQLEEAKRASETFLKELMALLPGKERIDYLRNVDHSTSRLLAMHKLWEARLTANGPIQPTTTN